MIYKFIIILLFSTSECLPLKKKCKTELSSDITSDKETFKHRILKEPQNNYDNLLIDVIFTVLHNNNEGKVLKNTLKKQISVLNDAFSGKNSKKSMISTNIRFRINEINYINNKDFYRNCDSYDSKISRLYGVDNHQNINIIICESDYYLGWAYMPWYFNEINKMNSIYINTVSLPSNEYNGYNLGMTAVHEMGHFFGLLHTFSSVGKCEDGDMVQDTPIEKYPSFTCDERDSCPEHQGKDPITNYMDYSPDECMYEFSFQQINRMWDMIDRYKPKLKLKSQNNYLKSKNKVSYYKKGNGMCVDSNGDKFESVKINNNGKYISQIECKKYISMYNSYAYTYITELKAKESNFKYNCFIHKVHSVNNIKNDPTVDKNKFKNANCFSIKLIPKKN